MNTRREIIDNLCKILKNDLNKLAYVLLKGEMGVGKTTFVKKFAVDLGVNVEVVSPTYALLNEYQISNGPLLYHADLWRLDSGEFKLADLGIDPEELDTGIVLIEWAEKLTKKQLKRISTKSNLAFKLEIIKQHESDIREYNLNRLN
jgi:tRNA threonylcarbamoyl adenosine modification protein YjeE